MKLLTENVYSGEKRVIAFSGSSYFMINIYCESIDIDDEKSLGWSISKVLDEEVLFKVGEYTSEWKFNAKYSKKGKYSTVRDYFSEIIPPKILNML